MLIVKMVHFELIKPSICQRTSPFKSSFLDILSLGLVKNLVALVMIFTVLSNIWFCYKFFAKLLAKLESVISHVGGRGDGGRGTVL